MTDVVVIGEAIADFLPEDAGPERFRCVLGGSGFNTALALARLGLKARYAGSLSRDALGRRFAAALAQEGIDATLSRLSELATPVAIVSPGSASHGAMFALHLAGTAQEEAPALGDFAPGAGAHVHAASFAAMVGPGAGPSLAWLRAARAVATSSFDPNIRAACLPPRDEAIALVEARVAASAIAKASAEDFAWLYPGLALDDALRRWAGLGAALAIASRGADGALALSSGAFVEIQAPPVLVVDTVGAGDVFSAGLLAAMARGGRLGAPASGYAEDDVAAWLGFAVRAASLSCARPGCDPPRAADLA